MATIATKTYIYGWRNEVRLALDIGVLMAEVTPLMRNDPHINSQI